MKQNINLMPSQPKISLGILSYKRLSKIIIFFIAILILINIVIIMWSEIIKKNIDKISLQYNQLAIAYSKLQEKDKKMTTENQSSLSKHHDEIDYNKKIINEIGSLKLDQDFALNLFSGLTENKIDMLNFKEIYFDNKEFILIKGTVIKPVMLTKQIKIWSKELSLNNIKINSIEIEPSSNDTFNFILSNNDEKIN